MRLRIAPVALLVASPVGADSVSSDVNSAGMWGAKEDRMEELRLSRSRASRAPVEGCKGELPFSMRDGMADGLEPEGGEPELMMMMIAISGKLRHVRNNKENTGLERRPAS